MQGAITRAVSFFFREIFIFQIWAHVGLLLGGGVQEQICARLAIASTLIAQIPVVVFTVVSSPNLNVHHFKPAKTFGIEALRSFGA